MEAQECGMINEQTMERMLEYLTELYLTVDKYPHFIQGFWGVPSPDYYLKIQSKQELYGRIKQLGQLLNAKAISVTQGSTEITVELL